jgi:aminoglycoside phosphotransferase (APT) family kinase protein
MEAAGGLDIERADDLVAWLRATGRLPAGEQPEVTVLGGGVSSRAVLVRSDRRAWVLKQALAKLRVPVDWFSDPLRVHREASALRWLAELAPAGSTPQLVFEDSGEHVVCMTAVPRPHENWKTMLLAGDVRKEHVERFATILATIHVRSGARLEELEVEFGDRGFFETLRLEPYYGYAAETAPAAAPFLHALQEETRAVRATLVHGDYSPKNVLVHAGRLGLVDHEVSHLGDPAFDVGFSSAHLLSKAHHLPGCRGSFLEAARAHWRTYASATAAEPWREGLEPRSARQTVGCLLARVAGRSQLEYLSAAEKERQLRLALELAAAPPNGMAELVDRWEDALS